MTTRIMLARWSVVSVIGIAAPLSAQPLPDRVSSASDGMVNFHFAARPGVCGDGIRFLRMGRSEFHGTYSAEAWSAPCSLGPVQVRLTVRGGNVDRVETWAGTLRLREGQDLGAVSSPEAARYLLGVVLRGSAGASAKAILPAVLADSATIWPTLLEVAKDSETRSRSTRTDAAFWLSRFASATIAGHRNQPFDDNDDDRSGHEDLKSHAVFVLSQFPHGGGINDLLNIARSNSDRHVRSQALFWLSQTGDPRAIALFESILRG